MGLMRVNKLVYEGNKYYFESKDFDENIILVEGDNGTGKSTFCNLIYFALGGEVPIFRRNNDKRHDEITSDSDNYVDLYVSINEGSYLLRRYFGDNEITIIPCERVVEKIYLEDKKTLLEEKVRFSLSEDKTEIYPVNRSNVMRSGKSLKSCRKLKSLILRKPVKCESLKSGKICNR